MFFENLATKCLIEDAVNIGDCFQIGSAKAVVTLLRIPGYNSDLDLEEWTFVREYMVSSVVLEFILEVLQECKVGPRI
jgi:MOSC domain-containing protein YiiM